MKFLISDFKLDIILTSLEEALNDENINDRL